MARGGIENVLLANEAVGAGKRGNGCRARRPGRGSHGRSRRNPERARPRRGRGGRQDCGSGSSSTSTSGMGRCGVRSAEAAAALAEEAEKLARGARVRGRDGLRGAIASTSPTSVERRRKTLAAMERLVEAVDRIRSAGIDVEDRLGRRDGDVRDHGRRRGGNWSSRSARTSSWIPPTLRIDPKFEVALHRARHRDQPPWRRRGPRLWLEGDLGRARGARTRGPPGDAPLSRGGARRLRGRSRVHARRGRPRSCQQRPLLRDHESPRGPPCRRRRHRRRALQPISRR